MLLSIFLSVDNRASLYVGAGGLYSTVLQSIYILGLYRIAPLIFAQLTLSVYFHKVDTLIRVML